MTFRQFMPWPPALVGPCRCLKLRCRCFLRRHPRWSRWLWVIVFAVALALGISGGIALGAEKPSLRPLLDALWAAESSCRENPPPGDGGRAIGPLQIWRSYWQDAMKQAPDLGGTYQDCKNRAYAEFVVVAYWTRYCPKAIEDYDFETLARTHKGGPNGAKDEATLAYWEKVKQELGSER